MYARSLARDLPWFLLSQFRGLQTSGLASLTATASNWATSKTSASEASRIPPGIKKSFEVPRIKTPLSDPLPGINLVPPYKPSPTPPPTEITVLDNGVRIVSEASAGPTASLGVYVNSGSIYETEADSGCSTMLECLAFKSTQHRETTQIMTEVEKIGSNIMANASREQMSYTVDCLKTNMGAALELLCDCVLNPRFREEEVEEQKMRLSFLLQNKDLQMTLLNERLVRASYSGALGHPLIPDLGQLDHLTPDLLHSFVAKHYTAPRVVLAAAGVDHAELVRLATPMLSQLPKADPVPEPLSAYLGNHVQLPGSYAPSNMLLAFEYKGGWRNIPGAVAMTVLTYLLGGGNSFSSGGPGKGMHSRLYTRVLNQHAWVHSCTAFNTTFNDSGLLGIQASCDPPYVHDMLNVMCNELEAVTRPVSSIELDRAKRSAVSIIYNALESKATSAEDIGRQFLTYGQRLSGKQYVDMIQSISSRDISNFVISLLDSRPSLAVYGDNTEGLSYSRLLQRYSPEGRAEATSSVNRVGRAFGLKWQ